MFLFLHYVPVIDLNISLLVGFIDKSYFKHFHMSKFYNFHLNILTNSEPITVYYSNFIKCTNPRGGAIYSEADRFFTITCCTFSWCHSLSGLTYSGGGAIYIAKGIINFTKCCIYQCSGDWASDVILFTPSKTCICDVQSTLASSNKGHAFDISSSSTDNDGFIVERNNISNSFVTKIETLFYPTGLLFFIPRESDIKYLLLSNCTSGNKLGALISFDNPLLELGFQICNVHKSVFINNICNMLLSARDNGNTMKFNFCTFLNNDFSNMQTNVSNIEFKSSIHDFKSSFMDSASFDEFCSTTHIEKHDIIFGQCETYDYITKIECKVITKKNYIAFPLKMLMPNIFFFCNTMN